MKDKTKAQKNNKGTEKKKFSIWKAVLITLGSVIALAGIIFLIIFLTGGFDNPPKNPENIYFADVVVQEDGSTSYVAHGSSPYDVEGNFKLVVSTSTEEFNQTGLELNFPSTQTKYYLMEVDLEDQVSEASRVFYAFDEYGNRIKFASCGQAQATHITNGVVIVPRYVSINSQFDVLAVIAPDDLNSEITAETPRPASIRNSVDSRRESSRSLAQATTAFPRGCSLFASTEAAKARISESFRPSAQERISLTCRRP